MPRSERLLLDTHALLWWQAVSDRLSRRALARIDAADELLISPITFWEVATLVRRGRIALDRPTGGWVNDVLADERIATAALTPMIAVTAGAHEHLPGDPADRVIYATATTLAVPLVTKDASMTEAAATDDVIIVW
jgi:PIN domain nuclease of toxin-antitoxin system